MDFPIFLYLLGGLVSLVLVIVIVVPLVRALNRDNSTPSHQPADDTPIPSRVYDTLSTGEKVHRDTGEIIDLRTYENRRQRAAAIEYAKDHHDVPLYKQAGEGEELRVVITGKLDMPRRLVVAQLNQLGVKVGNAVNGKTHLVFNGEHGREVKGLHTVKRYKAYEKGLQVYDVRTVAQVIDIVRDHLVKAA